MQYPQVLKCFLTPNDFHLLVLNKYITKQFGIVPRLIVQKDLPVTEKNLKSRRRLLHI